MKFLFIDRIDGNYIVCEDENGDEVVLNSKNITERVKEGDVIRIDHDNCMTVDLDATYARKKEIFKLRGELKKN